MKSFDLKFILSIVLSVLLGALFLFSAYVKLFPVEPFEYTFIDLGVASWMTAPFVARLLIGVEFFCGILLILHFRMRRFTIPLVVSLLVFFCIYLLSVLLLKGDKGNCGCFGEYYTMTPLQAIIKNVGLLLLSVTIYFLTKPFRFPLGKIIGALALVTALALPFILNTVDLESSQRSRPETVNYRIPLEVLYHSENPKNTPPSLDLLHGKYIIAYLSLTCPHCRVAAQKIHVMHKKNPSIPFYIIMNGKKEAYQPYVETYGLTDIPHELFFGPKEYISMASHALPTILWVNNSIVEKKSGYENLSEQQIVQWLASDSTSKK